MRYLKTYEGVIVNVTSRPIEPGKFYWKIPVNDKLKFSLLKLGAPTSLINYILENILENKHLGNFVFVRRNSNNLNDEWGYADSYYLYEHEYEYKGILEADDLDIGTFKYNL